MVRSAIIVLGSIEINGGGSGGSGCGWSIKTRSSSSCSPVKRFRFRHPPSLALVRPDRTLVPLAASGIDVRLAGAGNAAPSGTSVPTVMVPTLGPAALGGPPSDRLRCTITLLFPLFGSTPYPYYLIYCTPSHRSPSVSHTPCSTLFTVPPVTVVQI